MLDPMLVWTISKNSEELMKATRSMTDLSVSINLSHAIWKELEANQKLRMSLNTWLFLVILSIQSITLLVMVNQ